MDFFFRWCNLSHMLISLWLLCQNLSLFKTRKKKFFFCLNLCISFWSVDSHRNWFHHMEMRNSIRGSFHSALIAHSQAPIIRHVSVHLQTCAHWGGWNNTSQFPWLIITVFTTWLYIGSWHFWLLSSSAVRVVVELKVLYFPLSVKCITTFSTLNYRCIPKYSSFCRNIEITLSCWRSKLWYAGRTWRCCVPQRTRERSELLRAFGRTGGTLRPASGATLLLSTWNKTW